jgi:ABC-2 type transport system ATP-binding protein
MEPQFMETVLEVERAVKRRYAGSMLGPLDLHLAPGRVLGIMGPHRAGKTTLLRMLWGFLRPDAGRITVFGRTPHLEQVEVRLRTGYVARSSSYHAGMTGRRFLEFVSAFYPTWDWKHARRLVESFGVEPAKAIEHMSGAGRTKLAMVAALTHQPRLLILDEPTAGLDPGPRREILDRIRSIADDDGTGIVLSTAIPDDIGRIADSVLMLRGPHDGGIRPVSRHDRPPPPEQAGESVSRFHLSRRSLSRHWADRLSGTAPPVPAR